MKTVIVYTQPNCPPCEFAKNYFADKKIDIIIKDVKKNRKAYEELTKKYKSYSTPTIVIDDEVIIGFKQDQIESLLRLS